MTKPKYAIVSEVTPESMDGDTPLEKEINAFLTSRFILGADVPSDECLHEARIVIRMVTEYLRHEDVNE